MNNAFAAPVFAAYALAALAIVFLLYALGFLTAKRRAERQIVLNPEDAAINGGARVADDEHPDVLRLKRAHQNLIESAIPFLLIGLLYTATDPSVTLARVLFAAFVAARFLHAFFYLNAKQPTRTISFAIGTLINAVMFVQILRELIPAAF